MKKSKKTKNIDSNHLPYHKKLKAKSVIIWKPTPGFKFSSKVTEEKKTIFSIKKFNFYSLSHI